MRNGVSGAGSTRHVTDKPFITLHPIILVSIKPEACDAQINPEALGDLSAARSVSASVETAGLTSELRHGPVHAPTHPHTQTFQTP